jgi:hypothetical protein
MKHAYSGLAVACSLLLPTVASAQLLNGNFETQYPGIAPRGRWNVHYSRPPGVPAPTTPHYNDLPQWYTNYSMTPSFVATNGVSGATPASWGFVPHNNGTGSVVLTREGYGPDDSYLMQKVHVIPGRRYKLSFFALRLPTSHYKSKLAAHITYSEPISPETDGNYFGPFRPTPGFTVASNYVTSSTVWAYAAGTFKVPAGITDPWLTVGYADDVSVEDLSLPGTYGNVHDVVDDVNLEDLTSTEPCGVTLYVREPRQVCSNQSDIRFFRIAYPVPGMTYEWRLSSPGGDPANGIGLIAQQTSTSVQFGIFPWQLAPGVYPYAVRGVATVYGETCYTEWTESKGLKVGEFCDNPYDIAEYEQQAQLPGEARAQAGAAHSKPADAGAYPNPAATTLTVPVGAEQIQLLNDKGRRVAAPLHAGALDVRNLPDGLYTLRFLRRGQYHSQRIQVQH